MTERKSDVRPVLLAARSSQGHRALQPARETLDAFGVPWTEDPSALSRACAVIVASADAGPPGEFAAVTERLVVRVPVAEDARGGLPLLQDPATGDLPAVEDAPFATVAIGEAGAKNAALFVVSILALEDPRLWAEWLAFRQRQTDAVLAAPSLFTG